MFCGVKDGLNDVNVTLLMPTRLLLYQPIKKRQTLIVLGKLKRLAKIGE